MAEEPHAIRRGRVVRAAPLLGTASRTAGEAVVASLRKRVTGKDDGADFHARAAERYAQRLGRSKGVLMKAGQILSFVNFTPAVDGDYQRIYRAALQRLQDDAPPMPYEVARGVIISELGAPPEELFAEFDRRPLAAASIGQVHAARLHDGRRVAMKIQYPGVAEAMRSDLQNTELLATFLQLGRPLTGTMTRLDVKALAREVTERIGGELDYRAEAANQSEFADAYRGHPFIRVPEVVPELCTGRVFTQDLADGMRWQEALQADQELKDRWGEVIYRFTIGSMRRLGLFNADPHPGNYLFNPDGTVTFVDFGCVTRFTPGQVRRIADFVTATVDGDADALAAAVRAIGFIDPASDDPPAPEELTGWFGSSLRSMIEPQPYTYSPEEAAEIVQNAFSPFGPHRSVVRQLTTGPAYLFLMRIDMGMTAVLGDLRATGHWDGICREWDRGGPPATPLGEQDQEFWKEHRANGNLHRAGSVGG
ncbi:ABC1 kinase family protein [Actinomadura rudentiformis]|uniref:AarF/ABC1/UbiB kinase family protein n=1 Tax=Actinomadura rudentiformis TaxID=359158 RepID=A0A6H9YQC6_9ACTN|nr:AarF/ABC1/UbiB kinase family protein [Actinomadura rudentiformis]KAB2345093.1 AarF/ABC1/UbiB kinase family protein [Actinomadura rudentiformis]